MGLKRLSVNSKSGGRDPSQRSTVFSCGTAIEGLLHFKQLDSGGEGSKSGGGRQKPPHANSHPFQRSC